MGITSIIRSLYVRITRGSPRRFEILLPLEFNDGTPIEREKFDQTFDELIEHFNGLTADLTPKEGRWVEHGITFKDKPVRVTVDATKAREAKRFLRQYKTVLKERFQQRDIWIISYKIEIL